MECFYFLKDYKGQKLAEQIFQGIILVSAVSGVHFFLKMATGLSCLLRNSHHLCFDRLLDLFMA
uniref:Uncharacterized protein n=1 Tax=Anguilla anguilla TaxID=7936 RepID=A0A0E9R728_ANGAN